MYECNNATVLEDAVLVKRQHIDLSGSSLIALVNVKNRIHLVLVANSELDSTLGLVKFQF